jgi:hypothetical protein
VYVLDFTIAKSGTYSIAVTGEFAANSPVFKVDTPANLYAAALSNALAFYQNQRDGADFVPSGLRTAAGHLNDKSAKVYQTPETGGREGWHHLRRRTVSITSKWFGDSKPALSDQPRP